MATSSSSHLLLVLVLLVVGAGVVRKVGALWCVSKSNVNKEQLQAALQYACEAGADCAPIQSSGSCFSPNTLESHASYAFNSYYQRKNNTPGSCDFSGAAAFVNTNPSYGSCIYPDSLSSGSSGEPAPEGAKPGAKPWIDVVVVFSCWLGLLISSSVLWINVLWPVDYNTWLSVIGLS